MKNRLFKGKNIRSISNHPMQFTVWRYSGKSRVIIEFFTTAIIASVIHWLLRQILDLNDGITIRVHSIIQLEKDYTSLDGQAGQTDKY